MNNHIRAKGQLIQMLVLSMQVVRGSAGLHRVINWVPFNNGELLN